MSEQNKTNGAEHYTVHPAIARALTADGYDLGKIVASVKAQKGRSKLVESSDKLSDVKIKEATESRSGESTFKRNVTETFKNDLSAPMRFAAFTDSLTAHWKKHGEPSGEITTAIVPAHLVVWLVSFKTDEKVKADKAAASDVKPGKNGRHNTPVPATA